MEKIADTYLQGKIRFQTEVLDIRRASDGSAWEVQILDLKTGMEQVLTFARIVLCTGVRAFHIHMPVAVRTNVFLDCRDAIGLSFPKPCRQSLRNKFASVV